MADTIKILGIAGSLRKASYNKAALREAQQLCPAGAAIEIFDLEGLPVFNQDDEKTPAPKVIEMKAKISAADALLIVTPEYNYSIPGVLKNAIDWGSRPFGDSAWNGKPTAIMGASVGQFGSVRAQNHLRQIFVALDMNMVSQPEVMIGNAAQNFDDQGKLSNAKTRELIALLLQNLIKRVPRKVS